MSIIVQCTCGRRLKARDEFAGKRADCPHCGTELTVPKADSQSPPLEAQDAAEAPKSTAQETERAVEITEFLDPPSASVEKEKEKESAWLPAMLEALLDPRSIQWMLVLGGGLGVLGLVIALVACGVFENEGILAVALGIGSLAILATGWFIALRTRYKVAGQAVTFLGCVVAPLNLWFWHAHAILTLDGGLWAGGVLCCLLYAATVYVLRDPLFMYAVEAGITLTVGLFLAEVGMVNELSSLCLILMGLGLISIHAERAFAPDGEFARARFGMPLFWTGHAQLAASLLILLGTQTANWFFASPLQEIWQQTWQATPIVQNYLLAGGLWLAGMYAYLYSDIVVRRVGIYTMLAAACMIMSEVTVAYEFINQEGLIIVLALTAMAATVLQSKIAAKNQKLSRAVPPLAMALSALPILIGLGLFIRATSTLVAEIMGEDYTIGPWFVISMLVVAVANRVSAYATRHSAPAWSGVYFFASAAALMVTAAGLLQTLGVDAWHKQAPWLMLIPLAYMVASRLWRGHSPAQPLYWVAQASTAVILFFVAAAAATSLELFELVFQPRQETQNLLLGLVFVEATVFYTLGMVFRRRSANVYLAAAAACGAMWQLLGYWAVPGPYYTMMYAVLGIGLLAVSRAMGVSTVTVYLSTGGEGLAVRGKGLAPFQTGNAIVLIALLAGFLQGLMLLLATPDAIDWGSILALTLTIVAAVAAAVMVPRGAWRRLYVTATVALGGLLCLSLYRHIDISPWQKLEIFSVVVGVLLISVSYVGRFRETDSEENEMVSMGLWLGSLMAAVPLVVAVICHWDGGDWFLIDQIALLTVTVLMVLTGYSWQVKSTTFLGGMALVFDLLVLVVSLSQGLDEQWIVGVYLTVGGGLIFAIGVGLSMYRERLLELPERISNREGVFRILNWR